MTTIELIRPPRAPRPPERWGDERRNARPAVSVGPSSGEMLEETLSLISVVPLYGPAVVLLAGPWLLLGLLLAGPFALLFTLVVLLVAGAAMVGLISAIVATPYLLVRHLRGHWRDATISAPAEQVVAVDSRRVVA